VSLTETNDPDWPCNLEFYKFPNASCLGNWPDVVLASVLRAAFGVDALLDPHEFIPELDPADPYWFLGYIGGRWYLVSTAGTPLMGSYTDGSHEFQGDAKVRFVREVEIPDDCTSRNMNV
jgi:hypothetical protein